MVNTIQSNIRLVEEKCAKVDETRCKIFYDEDASEFPLSLKKSLIFLTRFLVIMCRDDIIVKKLCDKRHKRGYLYMRLQKRLFCSKRGLYV